MSWWSRMLRRPVPRPPDSVLRFLARPRVVRTIGVPYGIGVRLGDHVVRVAPGSVKYTTWAGPYEVVPVLDTAIPLGEDRPGEGVPHGG